MEAFPRPRAVGSFFYPCMKLRIQNHRIRLRLTKSEIEQLASQGRVACTTPLPSTTMIYSLNRASETGADFNNGELRVNLAEEAVNRLTQTDAVGFEATVGEVHLLIEKDFTCLTARPEERNGDFYPNPLEKRP